jgi:CspA family cold shock protein
MEGKVKFFNENKGYGFIIESETNKDYFVHHSNCLDNLKKDDVVFFELETNEKGLKAVNVKRKKVETIKT